MGGYSRQEKIEHDDDFFLQGLLRKSASLRGDGLFTGFHQHSALADIDRVTFPPRQLRKLLCCFNIFHTLHILQGFISPTCISFK
jgi:hypothetical protein